VTSSGRVGDVVHLTDLAMHRGTEVPGTKIAVVEHRYGRRIEVVRIMGACTSKVCAASGVPDFERDLQKSKTLAS
jgi:hypothetical protein